MCMVSISGGASQNLRRKQTARHSRSTVGSSRSIQQVICSLFLFEILQNIHILKKHLYYLVVLFTTETRHLLTTGCRSPKTVFSQTQPWYESRIQQRHSRCGRDWPLDCSIETCIGPTTAVPGQLENSEICSCLTLYLNNRTTL